jgi:hypothetical protein
MYWQLRDAFVLASNAEHLLDLVPDLIKINEAFVKVNPILCHQWRACGPVREQAVSTSGFLATHKEIMPSNANSSGNDFKKKCQ